MFKNKAEIATLATFLSLLSFVLFDVIGQNAVNPEQYLAAYNLYQNIVDSIKNLNPSLAPYITAQMVPARTDCTFADADIIEVSPHPTEPNRRVYKISDPKDKISSIRIGITYKKAFPLSWYRYYQFWMGILPKPGRYVHLLGPLQEVTKVSSFSPGWNRLIIYVENSCGVVDTIFVVFQEKGPDVVFRLTMDGNFEQVWPKTSQPVIYRLTPNGTLEQIQGPSQQ
jgi:hypothetical protein